MEPHWSLVSNHGHVYAHLAADQDARLRDIAEGVGITERTAAHIVNDLERGGDPTRTPGGRRKRYPPSGERKRRAPPPAAGTTPPPLPFLLPGLGKPPL